jgi:hypothetical protein
LKFPAKPDQANNATSTNREQSDFISS